MTDFHTHGIVESHGSLLADSYPTFYFKGVLDGLEVTSRLGQCQRLDESTLEFRGLFTYADREFSLIVIAEERANDSFLDFYGTEVDSSEGLGDRQDGDFANGDDVEMGVHQHPNATDLGPGYVRASSFMVPTSNRTQQQHTVRDDLEPEDQDAVSDTASQTDLKESHSKLSNRSLTIDVGESPASPMPLEAPIDYDLPCRQYDFRFFAKALDEDFMLQSTILKPRTYAAGPHYVVLDLNMELSTTVSADGTGARLVGSMRWFEEPRSVEGACSFAIQHKSYMRHIEPVASEIERTPHGWRVQTTYVLTTGETYGLTFDVPSLQSVAWGPEDLNLTLTHTKVSVSNALVPITIATYAGWNVEAEAFCDSRQDYRFQIQGELSDGEKDFRKFAAILFGTMEHW
eukprot:ANDGO_06180.mRNA.1 hypothetical protein